MRLGGVIGLLIGLVLTSSGQGKFFGGVSPFSYSGSSFSVILEDNVAPIITIEGSNPQIIEVGSSYIELGASAYDNYDGDISASILIDASSLNTTILGSYIISYNVTDLSGNEADEVTREVSVVDTTVPVIMLNGPNPQFLYVGEPYEELGAIALDNYNGDISETMIIDITEVNSAVAGEYAITYNAVDESGNDAQEVVRNVIVLKADQTISFANLDPMIFGDPVSLLEAEATSGLEVAFTSSDPSVATVLGNILTIVGAGSTTITAMQIGNSIFNSVEEEKQLTVEKATLTVLADDYTRLYNTANPTLTIGYSGFIGDDNEAVLDEPPMAYTDANNLSDVGAYSIKITAGNDANYDFQYVEGTLSIRKAETAISLSNLEQMVDGTPKQPTVSTAPENLNVVINYSRGKTPIAAGDYAFTATIEEMNYEGEETGTLRLTQVLGLFDTPVNVYPNPAQDYLRIDGEGPLQVEVMDLAGKTILESDSEKELDIRALPDGTFLLRLTNVAGETETIRFTKSN